MSNMIVASYSVMPMRKEPDHRSEMVSQVLFAEAAELIEEKDGWYLIETRFDQYRGWVKDHQMLLDVDNFQKPAGFIADWQALVNFGGKKVHLPFATAVSQEVAAQVHTLKTEPFSKDLLMRYISNYLDVPYLWGGRTVFGVDCSGFVQSIMRLFGADLPRDAHMQISRGEDVAFLQQVQAGDIAFFDTEGIITHVGIMLSPSEIVHASGSVRIDPIDPAGIIRAGTGERTHKLRMIKRIF